MFAVVSSGGKQYRVEPGSTVVIDRLAEEPGASITFDRVLLIGDGDQTTVGTPTSCRIPASVPKLTRPGVKWPHSGMIAFAR